MKVDKELWRCYFELVERRSLVIGFVSVVLILTVAILLYKNGKNNISQITNLPTNSSEERIENKFNLQIPDDTEKADLSSPSQDLVGIATRKYEGGLFTVDVLVDLPEGDYKAWLFKNESSEPVLMGNLSVAKGGYILNFDISKDLREYKRVVITSGKLSVYNNENLIMQGNFK